jgi:hypothetical protein
MAAMQRNHKDRLFCALFSRKEYALELYNAVLGTEYAGVEDLEVVTLEDALYLSMKNDVAVIFQEQLVLFEHQSTPNPNMPLRGLLYFAREYEGIISRMANESIYYPKLLKIPAPRYYVLYNGEQDQPDQFDMRLSEAFSAKSEGYEWTAHAININAGYNEALMQRSPTLRGYSELVAAFRLGRERGLSPEKAMDGAVDDCISRGILSAYLLKHKGEVRDMLLTEYDEEKERRVLVEKGIERGIEQGMEQGKASAAKEIYERLLRQGVERAVARDCTGISDDQAAQVEGSLATGRLVPSRKHVPRSS